MTTDQLIHYDGKVPKEVVIEDKTAVEQTRLIQQLEEEDKRTIFTLIEKMLTNKKFKDFFEKNVAMLWGTAQKHFEENIKKARAGRALAVMAWYPELQTQDSG